MKVKINPPCFFIDNLSIKTCLLILKFKKNNYSVINKVQILDPVKNTLIFRLMKYLLRLFSIEVCEANFFAGHLYTSNRKNIWLESQEILSDISYKATIHIISNSKILRNLSKQWDMSVISIYLNRHLFNAVGYGGSHTVFKILIADVLSQGVASKSNHLILRLPDGYTQDIFKNINKIVNVSFYSTKGKFFESSYLTILSLIIFFIYKKVKYWVLRRFKEEPNFGETSKATILLLQEDDLSLDRSYRGQPHWIFINNKLPEFRTLILSYKQNISSRLQKYLHAFDIYSVSADSLYCYLEKNTVNKKITKSMFAILFQSIFRSDIHISISFALTRLYMQAHLLTNFCINQNIKVFMTCENYYRDSDAMNLIAPELNIHSISYQYSNMSEITPLMLSSSDTICAFSPLFYDRWTKNSFKNYEFIYTGYLYDSSFSLLSNRVKAIKDKINETGAEFIISYFDENVSLVKKYGLKSKDDCYNNISPLIKMIINDDTIAIIIKSQFVHNSPSILYESDDRILSIIQTKRWIELHNGNNRNNIFPAEAALSSDFVIGHVEGATAGLEAALTGCRCVLINTHRMDGPNIKIFKQANIVFDNMESALSAISFYRQGDIEYRDLGDWNSIIDMFDEYQDGRSSIRLRQVVENKLLLV